MRFADDFVGSFQFWGDAQNFQRQLRERFAQFNLELAEEKTRLLLFGRFAAVERRKRGQRPETFEFLGSSKARLFISQAIAVASSGAPLGFVAGVPLHGPNQWPDLPGFREALEAYFGGVTEAGMKLMRVLATSLDLDEGYFVKLYKKPNILTRMIHYPKPEEFDESEFGIGAFPHTDYGHITILAQDPAGGLEIQLPGGEWIAAPFIQDTFVVNLGDLTARWTNDIYRSNPHRVVNRLNRDRISIPTFLNPTHSAVVECIPTCTSPERPPKYEPVLAGEYVTNKIKANQGYKAP